MEPLTPSQQTEVGELLHIAERYAQRFSRRSGPERTLSYEDFYQEGVSALCDCVRRRQHHRTEAEWYRYCYTSVHGACSKATRASVRQEHRRSVHQQEGRGLDIDGAADDLLAAGILPTPERIARVLGVSVDEVDREQTKRPRYGMSRPLLEPDMGHKEQISESSRDPSIDFHILDAALHRVSSDSDDPHDAAESRERERRVHEAIALLPVPLRYVVHLRYEVVLPITDIATRLHCHRNTVENRLKRARALMRDALSDLEDGPPETQPAHATYSR